jgi:hypothetical protein
MREIAIVFLMGALSMEVGVLYCLLKREFKNKMVTIEEKEER